MEREPHKVMRQGHMEVGDLLLITRRGNGMVLRIKLWVECPQHMKKKTENCNPISTTHGLFSSHVTPPCRQN